MFRFIATITLVLSIVAGVILNITAAINSGKNFFELATLNDLGAVFLVWGMYPLASAIILATLIASFATVALVKK